jgi:hypothetical protein
MVHMGTRAGLAAKIWRHAVEALLQSPASHAHGEIIGTELTIVNPSKVVSGKSPDHQPGSQTRASPQSQCGQRKLQYGLVKSLLYRVRRGEDVYTNWKGARGQNKERRLIDY